MNKHYFVLAEAIDGNTPWDPFRGSYSSFEEADRAASSEWNHYTRREQKRTEITVCAIDVPDGVSFEEAYGDVCERGAGWYVLQQYRYEAD